MRCTKCHYLSFEPEPRCKNCGHDLSMDDLLGDFDLDRGPDQVAEPAAPAIRADYGRGRAYDTGVATMTPPAEVVAAIAKPVVTAPIMTSELPLFVRDMPEEDTDDEEDLVPLVKVPARPRQPLAVRRTTPDPVKLRAKYAPQAEPDLLAGVDVAIHDEPVMHQEEAPKPAPTVMLAAPVAAGPRLAAAAIDAGLLGSIAAVVTMFTMQLAQLPMAQVLDLPLVPMLTFFALIGVGYELLFTAAQGQTIGKMMMGLRVVPDDMPDADRVSVKQAAVRALSLLPLGAGLVAALVGSGQAVHDRMAHTRVVRA
jgi:uncharacterized RDD family membrane protein YckC